MSIRYDGDDEVERYLIGSIEDLEEVEQSQVFMAVVFNFYGKENWSEKHIVNRTWKSIHNRVTANILNRFKQLCEVKFQAYSATADTRDPEIPPTREDGSSLKP